MDEMRPTSTVRRTEARSGHGRAWEFTQRLGPATLTPLATDRVPDGKHVGMRAQVIDVPVKSLGRPLMAINPACQPSRSPGASGVGVPSGRELELT